MSPDWNPATEAEYSVTGLAKLLSVSPKTVYRIVERGELQGFVSGTRRRFTGDEINRFLRRNTYIGDQRAYPDE